MNSVNAVSKAVLLMSGLAAMVLGARIGSAPDVFAYQLGLAHLPDTAIRALALSHGGGLLALGLFGVVTAFLSPAVRWAALAALLVMGIAAWFGVWRFAEGRGLLYGPVLRTLAVADLLALAMVTVFRDADRAAPKATDAGFHVRWG